jgi:hypothetical protein
VEYPFHRTQLEPVAHESLGDFFVSGRVSQHEGRRSVVVLDLLHRRIHRRAASDAKDLTSLASVTVGHELVQPLEMPPFVPTPHDEPFSVCIGDRDTHAPEVVGHQPPDGSIDAVKPDLSLPQVNHRLLVEQSPPILERHRVTMSALIAPRAETCARKDTV